MKHEIYIYMENAAKNSLALHLDPGQGSHNRSALTHFQLNLFQAVVPHCNDWDYFKGHLSTHRLLTNWEIIIQNVRKYPLMILTLYVKIHLVQE